MHTYIQIHIVRLREPYMTGVCICMYTSMYEHLSKTFARTQAIGRTPDSSGFSLRLAPITPNTLNPCWQ